MTPTAGEPERQPSRTAQAVALARLELDRPHTPAGRPDAQRVLCLGMAVVQESRLRPHVGARTRFFDELTMSAIEAGTTQVVVCGAGYDDRAMRFRTTGVRFFELDHPVTQADKARRLRAFGPEAAEVTLAPLDIGADDVAAVLDAAGHDPAAATLFICEGLLVYLDAVTCAQLLGGLRSRAAPGSQLAASLAVHRDDVDSATAVAVANGRRRAPAAEPWLTILPLDEHLRMLSGAGWHPARTVTAGELDPAAEGSGTVLTVASPAPAVNVGLTTHGASI